ncbi:pollen-specific leucine-rich repeat extensin-like protein 4 [Iris pallida]|uniref:Pollen-specific leucine-rich repeat extensin-like protein 4 n=1 Tax=Iris pallida TaxID=29817 RepID=A0AAX6EUG6_IRIPA|nr:pollen-specific leucine-rich repeat extensin-like protein 4 [Iris pallida]
MGGWRQWWLSSGGRGWPGRNVGVVAMLVFAGMVGRMWSVS